MKYPQRLFQTSLVVSVTILLFFWTTPAWSLCHNTPDRGSFDWSLIEDASPHPSGLMVVRYHERGNPSAISHATLHRVLRASPGVQPPLTPAEAAKYAFIQIEGELTDWTYLIFQEPLFYGTHLDSQGLPQQLWIDPEEDGENGNECAYTTDQ